MILMKPVLKSSVIQYFQFPTYWTAIFAAFIFQAKISLTGLLMVGQPVRMH